MTSQTAAVTLLAARRAAGLSQEVLAERAGVSSRTVRALESGQAKRPHRDTLLALGRTLGMSPADLAAFVESWRGTRREVDDVFPRDDPLLALQREVDLQRHRLRDRAIATVLSVRADRQWHQSTLRRRFEVIGGEVETFTFTIGMDVEVVDLTRIAVVATSNIEVVSSTPLVEAGAVAWTGRLGRILQIGDVYELEYTLGYDDAYLAAPPHRAQENADLMVLLSTLTSLSLEVRFDPAAPPHRVWLSRRESLDGAPTVVHEVVVNDFGIAQVYIEPAPAGVHGLEWEWPASPG